MATPAEPLVVVEGLAELMGAFAKAEKEVRLGVRREMRELAEPIRSTAQALAEGEITNIGRKWGRMRTGVTRHTVYVAPRQRGARRVFQFRSRRPNLADLLMDRAMQPALREHGDATEQGFERFLDTVADKFNRD